MSASIRPPCGVAWPVAVVAPASPRALSPGRPALAVPPFVAPGTPASPRASPPPPFAGPRLLGPGLPDRRRLTLPPRPTAPPLGAADALQVAQEIASTFHDTEGRARLGFVPLHVDAHPDGRLRLVRVMTELPLGFEDPAARAAPGVRPIAPGTQVQALVTREKNWYYDPGVNTRLDPDPRWVRVLDARVLPTRGPAVTVTSSEMIARSGFKHPAKLRELRHKHWRGVARALHEGRAVAPEVLAEYPGLAEFYGGHYRPGADRVARAAARAVTDRPDNPDITIEWSVETGLLLHTRGKERRIIDAIKAVRGRGMGFKWSSSLGAWFRPQSRGVSESTTDLDRVAEALRAQGMVVAIERGAEGVALGAANEVRQEHKMWRAGLYEGRAHEALGAAQADLARAEALRADVPTGAPTRRAERVEARAERVEARAGDTLGYVEHAATRARNLAQTAAGYDTTVVYTRREIEQRVDAVGALLVRQVKRRVGAIDIKIRKKDNLSEYRGNWLLQYPRSAARLASVTFDGRSVRVQVATTEGKTRTEGNRVIGREETLRADVPGVPPEAVFEQIVAALPVYRVDDDALAPQDPRVFSEELSTYGRKRSGTLAKLVGWPLEVAPAGDPYGNGWNPMGLREKNRIMGGRGWFLHPVGDGLRFRLLRSAPRPGYGDEVAPGPDEIPLDFAGHSIASAWKALVAAVESAVKGTRFVPPTPPHDPARVRATEAAGVGVVGALARDAPDAAAAARVAALTASLASVRAVAAEHRAALGESAATRAAHAGTLDAARAAGHAEGFYPTPPSLARELVAAAHLHPGAHVLEPSAGLGALLDAILATGAHATAFEVQPERANHLHAVYGPHGVAVQNVDFLRVEPDPVYDAVVMNPPFSVEGRLNTDVEHALHALGFVKPGGALVALLSPGAMDANTKRRRAFFDAVSWDGSSPRRWEANWHPVAAGRFRVSGTDTPTLLFVARRRF